jgi:hypothetical protein
MNVTTVSQGPRDGQRSSTNDATVHTGGRPTCFGLGRDVDSGRPVPITQCRACAHVGGCSVLRIARFVDGPLEEFFNTYLDARFPHGKSADRWSGRRE